MELSNSLLIPLLVIIISSHLILLQHSTVTAFDSLQPEEEPQHLKGDHHLISRPRPRNEIFHLSTGLCVLRKRLADPLKLGPCSKSDAWNYTPQKFLTVKGTYYCLQAVGAGQPVRLSILCDPSNSQWSTVAASSERQHLATVVADGTTVCLDVDSENVIISNPCGQLEEASGESETDTQWFKLITEYKQVASTM